MEMATLLALIIDLFAFLKKPEQPMSTELYLHDINKWGWWCLKI